MKTSTNGIQLIKHFEGFSPVAYLCPANYLTIGYGHVISETEKQKISDIKSYKITKLQAEEILQNDLIRFEKSVLGLISVKLSQNQFDALASFTYNLGTGALQRSSLRQKINRNEHAQAQKEFLKWVYAGGKIMQGLVNRRNAEAILYSG